MKRGLRIAALVLIVAALTILTVAYRTATADPVIREAHLSILPPGKRPLHVLLLSDIHVAGPDMPPSGSRISSRSPTRSAPTSC